MSDDRYEGDQVMRSRGSRGRWGDMVALVVISVAVMALGTFFVGVQHFGVPARITVEYCEKPSHYSSSQWFHDVVGRCQGKTNTESPVEFWGAHQTDLGHDVDVHITGAEAVVDGWILPPIVLAMGCVLGVGAVIVIVRRLGRGQRDER
jgi:hypothetical protein